MVKDNARRARPKDDLWGLVVVGVLAQIVGVIVALTSWPDKETEKGECFGTIYGGDECDPDKVTETGNALLAWLGVAFGSVGSIAMLIGIIGFGVMLGMRAHSREA